MAKRTERLTNKDLSTLLLELGFQCGAETEKLRRVWRHPDAGTTILLPSNKSLEPPLEVDLISMRTHLDYNGHMGAPEFDEFVEKKRHPVAT